MPNYQTRGGTRWKNISLLESNLPVSVTRGIITVWEFFVYQLSVFLLLWIVFSDSLLFPTFVKLCFLILKFWIFIWRFQDLQHLLFIYTSLGKCWPPTSFFLWFVLWFVFVCSSFIYLEFMDFHKEGVWASPGAQW